MGRRLACRSRDMMRGRGVAVACGLATLAVAVAVLVGCAAPDAVAPQQPAPSLSAEERASVEEQAAEPAPEPFVTTTLGPTTTLAAPTTTAGHEPAPATTAAADEDYGAAPTTTLGAPTTTAGHEPVSTTTAAAAGDYEADAMTALDAAASTATTAAAPVEDREDLSEPGNAYDLDDPAGETIDATGAAVPAEEASPSEAEIPTVAAPHREAVTHQQAVEVAGRLAPGFVAPNDCRPPPLNSPYSMPNAPRAYRSGVHHGVDFLCSTPGHPVVAALGGHVVVAVGGYEDPTLREWNELLGVATALGSTPAYTFAMLSGRHVVIDHGIVDDVGHVVSLYAHLDAVDPGIRVGMRVDAGRRLGGVGNTGTRAGVTGDPHGQLHLHWNLYVDGQFLGAGLSEAETRDVYAELFKHATGKEPRPEPATVDAGTGLHDQDGERHAPRPGPAGPGTLTPAGHEPLTEPITLQQALDTAARLSADIVVPSDCGPVPLASPSALPNAPRRYRSGTLQGVDFGCSTLAHPATAALAGRVVAAVGDFEDPTPQERNLLLDVASALGATPAYTLVMLYGNHVVVDHGMIDDVGHVVSLYAHLDTVEAGIRPGLRVEAGQPLGTIGNTGTRAGAAGSTHEQLHLHWELHIDGHYLGIGLSPADTRAVYTTLFENTGHQPS